MVKVKHNKIKKEKKLKVGEKVIEKKLCKARRKRKRVRRTKRFVTKTTRSLNNITSISIIDKTQVKRNSLVALTKHGRKGFKRFSWKGPAVKRIDHKYTRTGDARKAQLRYNMRLKTNKPPSSILSPYHFTDEATYITRKKFREKYRLFRKKLGEGGFGKVYGGIRLDGRPVAVKKVLKRHGGDLIQFGGVDVPEEFVHQLHASSVSDAIVKPLDFCQDKSHYIIIMEHPPSSVSLEGYVTKFTGAIPAEEIKFIFEQILDSIEKLHKNQIIHRDIKAENVLIDRNTKKVKLIDFGCATCAQRNDFTCLCGTEQQFPPEYFIHKRYNGQILDLWCLAQVLFFLVERRYPFETIEDIMACEVTLTVATGDTKDLILKMLHVEEDKRLTIKQIRKHPYMSQKLETPIVEN